VVLPMGTFAETSGTFVNVNCKPQSFGGIAQPVGECRPGWKILRVLGNLLELPDCEYSTSDEVVRELVRVAKVALDEQPAVAPARDESTPAPTPPVAAGDEVEPAELDVPIYQTDALVRRSHSLQMTRDGQAMRVAERKTA
jgi:NADH-quinone oxidoreductase subunit G